MVVGGVEGLAERDWPGDCLRIGPVLIGVQDLRLRYITTAYDPDTLVRSKEITQDIYRRFAGKLALDCCRATPNANSFRICHAGAVRRGTNRARYVRSYGVQPGRDGGRFRFAKLAAVLGTIVSQPRASRGSV